MDRAALEHVIRAAADVADVDHVVVVGSQAVLASAPDAPAALLRSMEADLYPRDHPDRAVVVEGAIGEGSPFHELFGYYAHGVGPETAKAPAGWKDRLVALCNENTRGATGWCLEPHDLVLANLVAGREKDVAFARDALAAGLVRREALDGLVDALPVDERARARVREALWAVGWAGA